MGCWCVDGREEEVCTQYKSVLITGPRFTLLFFALLWLTFSIWRFLTHTRFGMYVWLRWVLHFTFHSIQFEVRWRYSLWASFFLSYTVVLAFFRVGVYTDGMAWHEDGCLGGWYHFADWDGKIRIPGLDDWIGLDEYMGYMDTLLTYSLLDQD